jgi:uncharacterized membrane protein
MNGYLWLKYLHELAAIWFIAGILGRQLVRYLARQSGDVHHLAGLLQVASRFEAWMVIPGNLLVIGLGALLAWQGGWPLLGFLQGAATNWLLLTNLLLLAGLLLVPFVYIPRGKRFDQELQDAQAKGQVTPALIACLNDPVVKYAHWGEYVGLLIILALMVLKPF